MPANTAPGDDRRAPRRYRLVAVLAGAALAAGAVTAVGVGYAGATAGPRGTAGGLSAGQPAAAARPAPSGQPAPVPAPPPPVAGTACGAAFTTELPGETYQQALAREDRTIGRLDLARVFYPGLPAAWPGKVDMSGRPMVVSFKAPPAEILAGTDDHALTAWFAGAPRAQDTYWVYYHEPEDNIAAGMFTADQYRRAWQHLGALARAAKNPRLHATLVLMGWSTQPASGRNWRDYFAGTGTIGVLAWDTYNTGYRKGVYLTGAQLFGTQVAINRSLGLPIGVAETGSPLVGTDAGAGRAAWIRDITGYLRANGALFVSYFDLDWSSHGVVDYRLRDAASTAAWRGFCSR